MNEYLNLIHWTTNEKQLTSCHSSEFVVNVYKIKNLSLCVKSPFKLFPRIWLEQIQF